MKGIYIILLICVVVVLIIWTSCKRSEKYANRFSGPAYINECEFNPACLWDIARTVQLSNGMEGVCTLNGVACPAFSKNHDRARWAGKSPTMVDAIYDKQEHPWRYIGDGSYRTWVKHYDRFANKEGYAGNYTSPAEMDNSWGQSGETALDMLV